MYCNTAGQVLNVNFYLFVIYLLIRLLENNRTCMTVVVFPLKVNG